MLHHRKFLFASFVALSLAVDGRSVSASAGSASSPLPSSTDVGQGAAGAQPQPIQPPPGTKSRFHESFSGVFFNGQKVATEADISIDAANVDMLSITGTINGSSKNFTVSRKLLPSHVELEALTIAAGLQPMARATKSYQVEVPLFVSKSEAYPVKIDVSASTDGDIRTVQGTGQHVGTFSFQSYQVPYTYNVSLAAQYSASGELVMEKGQAQERVGEGQNVQNLSWSWTLSPS